MLETTDLLVSTDSGHGHMTCNQGPARGLFKSVFCDAKRLSRGQSSKTRAALKMLTNRGFKAVLCYRLSHAMWEKRVPILPGAVTRLAQFLYSVDIDFKAILGPGITITHCFGLVIGSEVVIDGDCDLFHGVTLGSRGSEWVGDMIQDGHPHIEAGCILGAGAKVLGPVRIGRNSVIGANAVVTRDVGPNSIMAGIPAKRISERPSMDANMRPLSGYRRTAR
jgi:serine O-acetyltransferase